MTQYKDQLNQTSEKKQQLIDGFQKSEFKVGEIISVPEKCVDTFYPKDRNVSAKIVKVNKKTLIVVREDHPRAKEVKIDKSDVAHRNISHIGANPFDEKYDSVRPIAYQLSSIIHTLDLLSDKRQYRDNEQILMNGIVIKELNWNPYVFDKNGNKQYYQRDFCWNLTDKQLLIESIYQKIDCGKILVREHGWKKLEALANNGETELAFRDVVDGKQRLKTIQDFIFNRFPDMHGNYYCDLSNYAQHKFTDHQLFSYAEMPESTTDEEVIYQFLKMNFTGVPQSQEHLDYVKELSKNL
ncbi:MAG: DUF262 domain-containing protein [bacterium]